MSHFVSIFQNYAKTIHYDIGFMSEGIIDKYSGQFNLKLTQD